MACMSTKKMFLVRLVNESIKQKMHQDKHVTLYIPILLTYFEFGLVFANIPTPKIIAVIFLAHHFMTVLDCRSGDPSSRAPHSPAAAAHRDGIYDQASRAQHHEHRREVTHTTTAKICPWQRCMKNTLFIIIFYHGLIKQIDCVRNIMNT